MSSAPVRSSVRQAMGPRCRIALVAWAIVLGVGTMPAAAQAFPANGGTETARLNMPADGIGEASTDQLPAKATQADIAVTPVSDAEFFGHLQGFMQNGGPVNFADRGTLCVGLTETLAKNPSYFPGYEVKGKTLQLLFLYACLELALHVSLAEANDLAHSAASGCFVTPIKIGMRISRSGSGYSANVTPAPKSLKLARSKVNLTCRPTAKGYVVKIRPRKRGQKLRSTIGPTLPIGFINPQGHPVGLKIAFSVK